VPTAKGVSTVLKVAIGQIYTQLVNKLIKHRAQSNGTSKYLPMNLNGR